MRTKFFYDTEFIDDGRTIDLISIGIVREDGEEYYAVSSEFNVDKLWSNKWLLDNVWPHLPLVDLSFRGGQRDAITSIFGELDYDHPAVKPRSHIAFEVKAFLLSRHEPELWAWYAAYDHVALAQLWGPMIAIPRGIPMYTHDLRQECDRLGDPRLPDQTSGGHDALADARHNLVRARALGLLRTPIENRIGR